MKPTVERPTSLDLITSKSSSLWAGSDADDEDAPARAILSVLTPQARSTVSFRVLGRPESGFDGLPKMRAASVSARS